MIGAMFPIIHLGRPWLFFWLMPYPSERQIWPNFRSPLVWDFFAISTYLTGSLLFLLLPMIPDFALVRDKTTGLRRRIYGTLALGWQGTTKQWHRLESAMQIMAIAIIPVAVSVHTIVSFDFSMAPVPMWHSTIFGPYFVAGAIFSGIAALIIAMAALRKFLHLEEYLHPVHFENLGKLLLLMSLLWGYFVFAERLTTWYGNEPSEIAVFWVDAERRLRAALLDDGDLQLRHPVLDPLAQEAADDCRLRASPRAPSSSACGSSASSSSCRRSATSICPTAGAPTGRESVEILIMISTFAAMGLLYMLFAKFVPIISIWELKVGEQTPPDAADAQQPERALGETQP